ncbi:MAG: sigma-E processing peptidase SpoIIGA [Clostridia bacterium]|nr:sigma-E processing peptidase SpoIIGA [Clostridia bacterium]
MADPLNFIILIKNNSRFRHGKNNFLLSTRYNLAMQVYIEVVIINNLLINALILTLTLRFLRHKISKASIFISSAIGTI